MQVIGITGGIACGKTMISDYLKSLGYPIIDADEEVKALYDTKETQDFIMQQFGTLDRKKLREIVFNSDSQKKLLEQHLHPLVYRNILVKIKAFRLKPTAKLLFVVIPLLFESRHLYPLDSVCCISCKPETQLKRLMQRDQNTQDMAKNIIAQQLPLAYKESQSDYILHNNDSVESLKQAIDIWLKKLI